MARQRRFFEPGLTMHVIQRGNARTAIFRAPGDYEVYLELLREAGERHRTQVHGYALMSNHVHVMATPQQPGSLPLTMQQLGRCYVPHFNQRYSRSGALFEGRYRAIPIDTDVYWLTCLRYVEQNPVRAGMVATAESYPWSSYRAHALGEWSAWLVPHPVYLSLGGTPEARQVAYRRLGTHAVTDPDLTTIRYAAHHGWAYGSAEFEARLEAGGHRRVARRRTAGKPDLSAITSGV
jgi:putative transposase